MPTLHSPMIVALTARFGANVKFRGIVRDNGSFPLPKLPHIARIPNVLSEKGIATALNAGESREELALAWAKVLGLYLGASCLDSRVDRVLAGAIDGTMPMAEWDLSGKGRGMTTALQGLACDSLDAIKAARDGADEFRRLFADVEVRV